MTCRRPRAHAIRAPARPGRLWGQGPPPGAAACRRRSRQPSPSCQIRGPDTGRGCTASSSLPRRLRPPRCRHRHRSFRPTTGDRPRPEASARSCGGGPRPEAAQSRGLTLLRSWRASSACSPAAARLRGRLGGRHRRRCRRPWTTPESWTSSPSPLSARPSSWPWPGGQGFGSVSTAREPCRSGTSCALASLPSSLSPACP